MHRQDPQPLHTGGLVRRIRPAGSDVDPARDGLVDDDLLLLLQQRNQLLLGTDVAPDPPVGVVEEAPNGSLPSNHDSASGGRASVRDFS